MIPAKRVLLCILLDALYVLLTDIPIALITLITIHDMCDINRYANDGRFSLTRVSDGKQVHDEDQVLEEIEQRQHKRAVIAISDHYDW